LRSPEEKATAENAKSAERNLFSAGSARSAVKPFVVLLGKEWRELMASRAWWVMLLVIGPLVGMSFISAVTAYGELSGVNGTAAGVGEAFSPLVGIWAPTSGEKATPTPSAVPP